MSETKKGKPSGRVGKSHSAETKLLISQIVKERTPRGEQHPNYIHGNNQRNKNDRRTTEYATWRKQVFERDGYTCQHCGDGKGGNLHAHHIKPYAQFPELRLAKDNGITLCIKCHENVHSKKPVS